MRKGLSVKVLQTGDILQTSFAKSRDEMKSENENNRLIRKFILSSPCLWAWFHPPYPLFHPVFGPGFTPLSPLSGKRKRQDETHSVHHQNWWKKKLVTYFA